MRIAIIGAGSVGATVGRAWTKHGEDVIWGLRNPADLKYAALPNERVKTPADAVKEDEVVVIATPFSFAEIKPFRISNYWGEPGGYFDIVKRSVGRLSEHGHAS